jgi:hypothetical protein
VSGRIHTRSKFGDEIKVVRGDQQGKAQQFHLGSSALDEFLKLNHHQQTA